MTQVLEKGGQTVEAKYESESHAISLLKNMSAGPYLHALRLHIS